MNDNLLITFALPAFAGNWPAFRGPEGIGITTWEHRLKATGARGSSWSSMVLVDDRIYMPNQSGDVFVLRAAPTFEVLAINSVNEPTNASLAISDGEIFLRTDTALWCIGTIKNKCTN